MKSNRQELLPRFLGLAFAALALGSACGESSKEGSPLDSGSPDSEEAQDASAAPDAAAAPDAGPKPDASARPDAGAAPDFAIAVEPPSAVMAGARADATIRVNRTNGHASAIQVALESNAPGLTGTAAIPAGASSGALTLSAPASAAPGSYSMRLSASDGALTREASFEVVVTRSSVAGDVAGRPFAALDAAFAAAGPTGGCPMNGLVLTVSNAAGLCARAADACLGKRDLFEIQLAMVNQQALGAGTYAVVAPDPSQPPPLGKFVAQLSQADSSCRRASPESLPRASSGSVTLDSVTDDAVSGSASIAFSDGGRLSGEFRAGRCSALSPANGFCSPPSAPTCGGAPRCE